MKGIKSRAGGYVYMFQFQKLGILTGSRAFGTARTISTLPFDDSDWDFVFPVDHYQQGIQQVIDKIQEKHEPEESGYFAGYKYTLNDNSAINFIPVHPSAFPAWVFATEAMKATLKLQLKHNPDYVNSTKLGQFEALLGVYRLTYATNQANVVDNKDLIDWVTKNQEE